MSRLTRSINGYIRSLQMSRSQVILFVEGKSDTYFYGKVAESVCRPAGISYGLCMAQELPEGSGGKKALITWFKLLRRRSLLINSFKGKTTVFIFFLDKDVDDFLRKQYRSDHLVYTKYYDVESHIFKEGNLGEIAAAHASIDPQLFLATFGSNEDWRQRVAEHWKCWVKLCLFAQKRDITGECNYSVRSPINNPLHGPVDLSAYSRRLKTLELRSGLSTEKFKSTFRRLSKLVDDLYNSREYDRVFKGKWYAPLLTTQIKEITGIPPQHFQALPDLLPKMVIVTLDFNLHWAEHFKKPLQKLMKLL